MTSARVSTTTTTLIDNRALTIQTFKLEPGMSLESLGEVTAARAPASAPGLTKIKLEPGLLQTLPPEATPLKVEIQDNYLDSGTIRNIFFQCKTYYFYYFKILRGP